MYIGELKKFTYNVYFKDTKTVPQMRENGSMKNGESLFVHWTVLMEKGADIHVQLEEECFVNEIVIRLAKRSTPTKLKVFSANKEMQLDVYEAETGKEISEKEIVLSVEKELKEFVIEFSGTFADLVIENLDIYGAKLEGETLFPTPKEYKQSSEKKIDVNAYTTVSYDCEIGKRAAVVLKEKYEELTGIVMEDADEGRVSFEECKDVSANGYILELSAEKAVIKASDYRGMVYGAETLVKLLSADETVECVIKDEPRMWFRGAHLMLPHPDEFEFLKRFVKYVLSPMGYNYIIMELAGGMEFESHPEINAAVEEAFIKGANGEWPLFPHKEAGMGKTVPKALVKEFVDFCRVYGIEVVPEIQSLGHVQFMTLAHPEIGEWPDEAEEVKVDERTADIPPNKFYAHCYCPSNPKSYEILFDLIDEIAEVFGPCEYLHLGHDEVYEIGVCPICKHRDPAELFAEDVNRIYDYVTEKGFKMMMWADMLQPVTKYLTPPAIHQIPKDILLLDFIWYFHPNDDIEDNLLPLGYDVVLGNVYSSHYPRYNTRIVKDGIVGAQVSSWVISSEDVMAYEGKIYEFLYSGQMLWSENYSVHSRFAYDKLVQAMMPKMREQLGDRTYPSMRRDASQEVLVDQGAFVPKVSPCGGEFTVDCKADSLVFEHTATDKITRIPWIDLDVIGKYVVTYEDGSAEEIQIKYSGNVGYWNRRHGEPFKGKYYRHNGYQGVMYYTDGIETFDETYGPMTIYKYEWLNPNPDKKIVRVQYVADEAYATNVFVSRILSVK